MSTEMIKIHSAEIQPNESFQPTVLFTASFPLVKHGTNISETEGLSEEQILQKLAKLMLEQVFDKLNQNKVDH